jgi:hypothetical protein
MTQPDDDDDIDWQPTPQAVELYRVEVPGFDLFERLKVLIERERLGRKARRLEKRTSAKVLRRS